uniref:sporulation protein YqfD n=1 Tax=Clostridium sp. NkU-1 TaxID=1095009 RepID=UPI000AC42DD0
MKDLKKSRRKIKFGIAAAVIFLGIVIFLSLQIRDITVSGNKKYTSEQIVNILFKDGWDRNAVFLSLQGSF